MWAMDCNPLWTAGQKQHIATVSSNLTLYEARKIVFSRDRNRKPVVSK